MSVFTQFFPSGGYPLLPHAAGSFYMPTLPFSNTANAVSNANVQTFAPFYVPVTTTATSLTVRNTTTTDNGEKCRLGIYGTTTGGKPGALTVDGGELTFAGAAAFNVLTISTVLTGPAWYWSSSLFDNNTQVWQYTMATNQILANMGLGGTAGAIVDTTITDLILQSGAFATTQAYGALPDPASTTRVRLANGLIPLVVVGF